MEINEAELIRLAKTAREHAYAPYSHFKVGAALLASDGKIYTGCNVENASFGATNCAERTAFFKAVSEGEREFKAIAIVGAPSDTDTKDACAPCGICRQVMREFCEPKDFSVILEDGKGGTFSMTLEELLPRSFAGESMG
ncbi:MAG: cytidine deaminase [Muribaculaceae bacterium]|nr:cytidine deaminase [Muribaculaceae bacterium]